MFRQLFQRDKNKQSLIKKYKQYRNIAEKFSHKVVEKYTDEKSMLVVSKLLGIREGKTLVLQSDEELNFIMDFSLYEYQVQGKTFLQRYKEDNLELDDKEAELLEAKMSAYSSLFKIVEVDPANISVTLRDILNDDKEVKITDINFSKTAIPGLLMFTRIIPLSEFNVTSGMFCIFPEHSQKSLLKRYKIMKKKVKSDNESIQKYVAFFKLNRKEGLEAQTRDI